MSTSYIRDDGAVMIEIAPHQTVNHAVLVRLGWHPGTALRPQFFNSMISPATGGKKMPRPMTGARGIFNDIYKARAGRLQHQ
jgi:hypothetical protein